MRLRNWIAVAVSVVLLMAMGVIGILVNRSALRAADTVHRADTRALAVNNHTLAKSMQLLSANELGDFVTTHRLTLVEGDGADNRALNAYRNKTGFFRYGLTITDPAGKVLNTTRTTGLPDPTDPGYRPLRAGLQTGNPGFSSVMLVNGIALQAVAVPIVVQGAPTAVVIGYIEVAKSQLQTHVMNLSAETHLTTIIDSTGRVGSSNEPDRIGTMVEPDLIQAAKTLTEARFVEYRSGKTDMIAVVAPAMPGGWAYVRSQTLASFEGAVHSRNQTINLTLLAMLLVGVIGISILSYRSQVQRRRSNERFQALFQHAPDLVAVLDAQGRIAYSSPSAATVLRRKGDAISGRSVFDVVYPEDRATMREQLGMLLERRDGVLRLQCRVVDAEDRVRWFEFTASNQMHNPALNGVVINARDISENRAFQERLTYEAQHDALTGLPNRRRMQDALDSSLKDDAVAVLFLDLDGFKPVNDAYGHEAGDELLRQVAERLSACVREQDVLSRVGGDEFVVLMPGVVDREAAESMSARVREAIEAPFALRGQVVTIGASVGVHLATPDTDPDQALREADHAMYVAKREGRERRHRPTVTSRPHHRTDERRPGRHRAEP